MRAERAYLAGLGTTGVLLLAALAVFLVAGALVAFDGWPGAERAERPATVLVDPGRQAVGGEGGPEEVAAVAAAVADDVAPAPSAAGAPPASGDGSPPAATPRGPGERAPDGSPQPSPPPGGTAPTAPIEQPPAGGSPVPAPGISLPGGGNLLPGGGTGLTDGLADGVESATGFLGDGVVGGVSPSLGEAVSGTGELVTDVLRTLDGNGAR